VELVLELVAMVRTETILIHTEMLVVPAVMVILAVAAQVMVRVAAVVQAETAVVPQTTILAVAVLAYKVQLRVLQLITVAAVEAVVGATSE
jgi:hypothetical protein